ARLGSRLLRHLNLGRHFDNWLPPSGAPDRLLHCRRHPSHQLIALLQFPPSPHSRFSRKDKPEASEPCTSTDDDSSLAGQEQVVAPGLATPANNAGEDPTILDTDSDSSLPVPDDSGGVAAKSNSQTKNIKDP
ncbi:unnamed protein product, partial [Coregonus sp. 'balchen']